MMLPLLSCSSLTGDCEPYRVYRPEPGDTVEQISDVPDEEDLRRSLRAFTFPTTVDDDPTSL